MDFDKVISILQGRKKEVEKQKKEAEEKFSYLIKEKNNLLKGKEIILSELKRADETVSVFEEVISKALKTVYGGYRDFSFKIEKEEKYNKIIFTQKVIEKLKNGKTREYSNILYDLGSGVENTLFLALSSISLLFSDVDKVLLLDEPIQNLGELTPLALSVLKELSEQLQIQVIIATHNKEMYLPISDKSFFLSYEEETKVKTL